MSKVFFDLEEQMWKSRVKSINQLSEMTGIGRPTLTSILKNKSSMIQLRTLSTLCHHLDCDVGDLMKYEKEGEG